MSRIGKKPILIPQGVIVQSENGALWIEGPKGKLRQDITSGFSVKHDGQQMSIIPPQAPRGKSTTPKHMNALWGTLRALISEKVIGVSKGFKKQLKFEGIGYRVQVEGSWLVLHLGFSHPIRLAIPGGIHVNVEKNIITVEGPDKELVGRFSAMIKKQRPIEPYKGKGIHYTGEYLRRKAGKKIVAAA